jgi:hypothetical protein
MTRIKAIPGIMWASDILTGQKPIPEQNGEQSGNGSGKGFKDIFDRACQNLKGSDHERTGTDRSGSGNDKEQQTDRNLLSDEPGHGGILPADPELVLRSESGSLSGTTTACRL